MREMCGVELIDRERLKDLMLKLGFNETMDHFAILNNVCCYGYVLRRWIAMF